MIFKGLVKAVRRKEKRTSHEKKMSKWLPPGKEKQLSNKQVQLKMTNITSNKLLFQELKNILKNVISFDIGQDMKKGLQGSGNVYFTPNPYVVMVTESGDLGCD